MATDGDVVLAPSDGVVCLDLHYGIFKKNLEKTFVSTYFFPVNIVSSREIHHCLKGLWFLKGHKSETSAPARIIVVHDPDIFNLTKAPTKSDRNEFDNILNPNS